MELCCFGREEFHNFNVFSACHLIFLMIILWLRRSWLVGCDLVREWCVCCRKTQAHIDSIFSNVATDWINCLRSVKTWTTDNLFTEILLLIDFRSDHLVAQTKWELSYPHKRLAVLMWGELAEEILLWKNRLWRRARRDWDTWSSSYIYIDIACFILYCCNGCHK